VEERIARLAADEDILEGNLGFNDVMAVGGHKAVVGAAVDKEGIGTRPGIRVSQMGGEEIETVIGFRAPLVGRMFVEQIIKSDVEKDHVILVVGRSGIVAVFVVLDPVGDVEVLIVDGHIAEHRQIMITGEGTGSDMALGSTHGERHDAGAIPFGELTVCSKIGGSHTRDRGRAQRHVGMRLRQTGHTHIAGGIGGRDGVIIGHQRVGVGIAQGVLIFLRAFGNRSGQNFNARIGHLGDRALAGIQGIGLARFTSHIHPGNRVGVRLGAVFNRDRTGLRRGHDVGNAQFRHPHIVKCIGSNERESGAVYGGFLDHQHGLNQRRAQGHGLGIVIVLPLPRDAGLANFPNFHIRTIGIFRRDLQEGKIAGRIR